MSRDAIKVLLESGVRVRVRVQRKLTGKIKGNTNDGNPGQYSESPDMYSFLRHIILCIEFRVNIQVQDTIS